MSSANLSLRSGSMLAELTSTPSTRPPLPCSVLPLVWLSASCWVSNSLELVSSILSSVCLRPLTPSSAPKASSPCTQACRLATLQQEVPLATSCSAAASQPEAANYMFTQACAADNACIMHKLHAQLTCCCSFRSSQT